jgi:hypothetical protein
MPVPSKVTREASFADLNLKKTLEDMMKCPSIQGQSSVVYRDSIVNTGEEEGFGGERWRLSRL